MSVYYTAAYDYDATSETELSFRAGETIEITYSEGDWWYGKGPMGEGWIAPAFLDTSNPIYQHVEPQQTSIAEIQNSSPAQTIVPQSATVSANPAIQQQAVIPNLAPDEMRQRRSIVLDAIIEKEKTFVQTLEYFAVSIFEPLSVRDDNFKRSFLADPSLGLCVSLLAEQLKFICSNFLNSIVSARQSGNARALAAAYSQFAPSLQVFAQYISENTNALSSIKQYAKSLDDFLNAHPLPAGFSLEQFFLLPVQHYKEYLTGFQQYVLMTPQSDDECTAVHEALDLLAGFSLEVDQKLTEEKERILLLAIQSKCRHYYYLRDMF